MAFALILYSFIWGLLNTVPRLDILNETIRNVYYHVPIWFALIFMMAVSFWYAIRTLAGSGPRPGSVLISDDQRSYNAALTGFFFSIPGILTGALWARFTWGTWWTFQDPKLNGVAISMLIYLAYFILRSSIEDEMKRAQISAVYNIFAFVMMNIFIMVLPRITDSLHPGNGGNPAFGKYDLDNQMRTVFYPAIIGWVLLSVWFLEIRNRITSIENRLNA